MSDDNNTEKTLRDIHKTLIEIKGQLEFISYEIGEQSILSRQFFNSPMVVRDISRKEY